jgi:hypothetical protein
VISAGNSRAKVCRMERADALIASARGDPIKAVIHGYRTASLNDWLTDRLLIHAATVISHRRPERTAARANRVKVTNSSATCGVASACEEEKTGASPLVGKMHRLAGASRVSSAAGWVGS